MMIMAEYIERGAMKQALRNAHIYLNEEGIAVIDVEDVPAADVVSKAAYDQVAWERHLAEVQLKSIGKSLGEKMDDVQPVVHGRWIKARGSWCTPGGDPVWECSECGKGMHVYGIEHGTYGSDVADGQWVACPNCGARMDGEI